MTSTSIYPCKICQKELTSIARLSKHLRDAHQAKSELYYKTHIDPSAGVCGNCGKPTEFLTLGQGFRKGCSQSCGTTLFRRNLRNDPRKFKQFSDKVSANMQKEWEKDQTVRLENMVIGVANTLSYSTDNYLEPEVIAALNKIFDVGNK